MGSRYQGPKRGNSEKHAFSRQGHIALPSELPLLVVDGFRVLPEEVKAAIRSATERGATQIREYQEARLANLEMREQLLMPELVKIRGQREVDKYSTRARLRIPLLEEPLDTID